MRFRSHALVCGGIREPQAQAPNRLRKALKHDSEENETTVVDMPAAPSVEPSTDQMNRVRELLFGKKTRQIETLMAKLEAKLAADHQHLREEMNERFDSLETFLKGELKALLEITQREEETRVDVDKDLDERLKSVNSNLLEQANALRKRLEQSDREHREELLAARQKLSDDLRKRTDELEAQLNLTSENLSSGKADRSTMAALLNDMALRLAAEDD